MVKFLPSGLNLKDINTGQRLSNDVIRKTSFKRESSQNRVANWLVDTAGFESWNKGRYIFVCNIKIYN